jgi:NAD(P)-dependent dehydrogenase (short-subunit alcohol dehydrogenase family)
MCIRHETHRINVTSYHFLTFAFLPLLAAATTVGKFPENGNVVNIASLSGMCKTSQRGQFNYNSAK